MRSLTSPVFFAAQNPPHTECEITLSASVWLRCVHFIDFAIKSTGEVELRVLTVEILIQPPGPHTESARAAAEEPEVNERGLIAFNVFIQIRWEIQRDVCVFYGILEGERKFSWLALTACIQSSSCKYYTFSHIYLH